MKHLTESEILMIHHFAKDNNVSVRIDRSESGDIHFSPIKPPVKGKESIHAGMQILYNEGIYEVSQYQAGKKQDELHIYLETKSLKIALKSLLKGNKRRKILHKW